MIYDITLRLSYAYARQATGGRHLVRLLPPDLPNQRLIAGKLTIHPQPDHRFDSTDFFANPLTEFAFANPYRTLTLKMHARVDRGLPHQPLPGPVAANPTRAETLLADLPAALAALTTLHPTSPLHFTAPSPRAPSDAAMAQYAHALLTPGMTTRNAILAIGAALHRDMVYDPDATNVDTPAAEAFALRHGVCQDFSHIMIICLRSVGIPAGYVSGFLRTTPPPGKPRLEGADAMHAWVRAWCGPHAGWLDYDPTNAVIAAGDHIDLAHGRDYFDVAPIKGILRISGQQRSQQSVDVVPLQPGDHPPGS